MASQRSTPRRSTERAAQQPERATGSDDPRVSKPTARRPTSGARSSDAETSSAGAAARSERIASRAQSRSAPDASRTKSRAERSELSSSRTKRHAEHSSGRAKSPVDNDRASADAQLVALRRLIDALNTRIARSIQERAQLALRIGAWKQLHGLPAADPRREREMLERVLASAGPGLEREQLARVFRALFRESRALVVKARKASKR